MFIVDSFKPRGIDSTTNNQGQVGVSANVADALYGLKLLASHPQIDAMRIFHMGGADDGAPADACVAYYTELNRSCANIQWKVYPGAFHNFDGSTAQTYLAQGVTAKNCCIEVFLTDVKGGGLGEARDYKTGAPINGWTEWNKAFAACNSRGFTVAANGGAKGQAIKDVLNFIGK